RKTHTSSKVVVSGLPKNVSVDFLTMFFENENRQGGGPVKHVEINEENQSALVEFQEAESVEKVMRKKPIVLQETEVKLSLFAEDSWDNTSFASAKIKVAGLDKKMSKEFLLMFFENEKRQGGGKVKCVEIDERNKSAIIEFADPNAVKIVLQKRPICIDGTKVIVEIYSESLEPKTLLVNRLPNNISEEFLIMFFENEGRQGGGKVTKVEINPYRKCAIIEFEESQSVKKVLKKQPIFLLESQVDVFVFNDTNIIEVRNFDTRETSEHDLIELFGNLDVSTGGKFSKVLIDRLNDVAFMTLDSHEAAKRACSRKELKCKRRSLVVYTCILTEDELAEVVSEKQPHKQQLYQHESSDPYSAIPSCIKERNSTNEERAKLETQGNQTNSSQDVRSYTGTKPAIRIAASPSVKHQVITKKPSTPETSDPYSAIPSCIKERNSTNEERAKLETQGNQTNISQDVRSYTGTKPAIRIAASPSVKHQVITKKPSTPEPNEKEGKIFGQVLQKLGLANRYPGKISMRDVIAVDPNESKEHEKQRISLVDIPWLLLKRLICAHSESRDITVLEEDSTENSLDLDNTMSFISDIPEDSQDISPLDIFTVVFQCCDPIMKQVFFQKLYLCKIAVPFLYKHWETKEFHQPILSVWPLRSLAIESKSLAGKGELQSKDVDVLELPTKVLAFARFGRPRYSKSKLINSLLTSQGCKTYYNIDCPSGMTPRYLSNGQIEMFWLPTIGDKKDRFQESMTFLNMRGDINEHFSVDILSFIANFVDAVVIIIDLETVLKHGKDVKDVLLKFSSVILIIANPLRPDVRKTIEGFQSDVLASKTGINLRLLSTHKGVVEQNVVDMVSSISKHITSQVKANKTRTYQERLACAKLDTIKTDEDDRTCQQGKIEAEILMKQMKNDSEPSRWKQILTPVHSTFSQQLGKLMKERERERDLTEGENIDRKIKTIRQKQTHSITKTVKLFVDILTRNERSHVILKFFLCWLHFYIEREKRRILPQLMHENRCAWEKLKMLKSKESQIPSEIENQEKVITWLEQKIDEASFSVEHLFREIGHINEAILELQENSIYFQLPPLDRMAKIIGRLVAEGHQLELIDGESFYMPYLWTKTVLKEVDRCIDYSKVMTLSVLGLQSSGKSTLLNTMFGSQFSTRTGRCTRGIHVLLIPTKTANFEGISSQFNYVLVADTEGLRSPELSHVQHEHDNELATVITGIGDITMLNIMGENTSEIRDILQVVVHAFLRLKMTNRKLDIRKSCAFIHQNVTDTSASENMISGLSKLMQTLDEMTKESAKSEGILEITTFNQVIEFDINSQVWYLKNLWQGNPPMARVNNEYSERVVDMKCKILQKALTMKDKSYKSLNDIVEQAHSLWKGVLNEDFVFSFRNSLEIRAYMEMEREVQDQLWHLESFIRDELIKISQSCFANCDQKDNLRSVADQRITELNDVLAEEKSKTEEVIKTYFEKNKYKDIIIQWKNSQKNRIDSLCQKLEQIIKEQIEKSQVKRSVEILTVASHEKHEEKLRKKSMEVANQYKGQKLTRSRINELFDDIWRSFITKVDTTSSTSETNRKKMKVVFETCLKNIFKKHYAFLKAGLVQSNYLTPIPNLKRLDGSFNRTGIDEKDISFTWFQKGIEYIGITDTMKHVTVRVNQIFQAIDKKIDLLCQVNDEITEMSVNKLMHELDASIHDILTGKTKYDFKIPFYVKIYIHVSRQTYLVFETHNENYFKTQGTVARLEQYKQQQKISFEAHLNSRQSEDIVAKLFSHVIEGFAEEWTKQSLPNKVTDDLYSHLPSVKNRVIVEICTDLLEKSHFDDFIRYVQAPKEYASLWITEKANYHLFGSKTRAYASIATTLLNLVFSTVEKCVRDLQNSFSGKKSPSIETWLNNLQQSLTKAKFSIPTESFRNVKQEIKHIQNVEHLTNVILANLVESKDKINNKFSQHGSGSVKWANSNPIDRIITKIWGCPEQCAFCGEPCAKKEDHSGSMHYSIQHRPSCCKGIRHIGSNKGCLESCAFDIQSDTTHKCGVFNYICNGSRKECGKTHYYRDYRTYLPQWDIAPSSNMHDTSKFWMWFVATYKKELHEYYNFGVDNIPPSWDEITKLQAKESLQKTYSA
ncbi:interferon-induced very large GTPase 1-like, partial [Mercenaria mercenaria]|uniref:interferon-induced very large GTPase 1-like n=1 Tax=Mercenaria mercenaria TaxID=6596 RepID=UPI00234F8B69